MKASVVIPAYNRADYLPEAISSVLAQTFADFELIVVDDGSTDNTAPVVRSINDTRLRYLYQENRGVSAALNTGWRAARGEYVAIIGSDDAWLPTLLEELLARAESDSNIGVVFARAQGMDADGNALTQLCGTQGRFVGQTLKSLVYGDFVCPIAVLLRRDALERIGGYDESLIGNEDWDLWLRIAKHYEIAYVPKILARYRFHTKNMTRTDSTRMEQLMQDRVRVLDKFFAQSDVNSDILDIKPIAYRNVYLDWTIRYLERRAFRSAAQTFQRALSYAPSRLTFLPRAAAVVFYYLVLSKTGWGVRLVDAWSARRRSALTP